MGGVQAGRAQLLQRLAGQVQRWVSLLQRFLRSEDDQVEILLTLEEFCGEAGSNGEAFAAVFAQVTAVSALHDYVCIRWRFWLA